MMRDEHGNLLLRDAAGNVVTEDQARALIRASRPKTRGGRRVSEPAGYADKPGTGPDGETCRTCRHIVRVAYARVYLKCDLCRPIWTHGRKSDIKSRTPACSRWEASE